MDSPNTIESCDPHSFIALHDFKGDRGGRLSIKAKEEVWMFLHNRNRQWCPGQLQSGQIGWLPRDYIAPIDCLNKHSWYHGQISRIRAEAILESGINGSFLIRKNKSNADELSLCVRFSKSTYHYRIMKNSNGKLYISDVMMFSTLAELVHHHSQHADGLVTTLHYPAPKSEEPTTYVAHKPEEWEIDRDEICIKQRFDVGHYSDVYEGVWTKHGRKVAVKTLKEETAKVEDFLREANLIKKLKHKNLVQLIGVCTREAPFYIFMEFLEGGNLLAYLRDGEKSKDIDVAMLMYFAAQVASAMMYLGEMKFIHRDLAARSCLLARNNVLKLGNFDMTLLRPLRPLMYTTRRGLEFHVKWTAPEVLKFNEFTVKSDVWAFGVLLWELATYGKSPYPLLRNAQVYDKISTGYRMPVPEVCPDEAYELMKKCWAWDANDRPSFVDIHRELINLSVKEGLLRKLLIQGGSYRREGLDSEAIEIYERAAQIANETDRPDIQAKAYQNLGNVFAGMSVYEKANEYYQKAREVSPNIEANEMEVMAYQWAGYNHLQAKQYGSSIKYYKEAVKFALQLECKTRAVNANMGLGSALSYNGHLHSAMHTFFEALTLAKCLNNKCLEMEAQTNLGHVYYKRGEIYAALKSYLEAQKLSQDFGDRKEEANTFLLIANIFQQMKQFENAVESYNKALNISKELGDKEGQAQAVQGLGSISFSNKEYEKALTYTKRLVSLTEEDPKKVGPTPAIATKMLGMCYAYLGSSKEALICFEKALKMVRGDRSEKPLERDLTEWCEYCPRLGELNSHEFPETPVPWKWEERSIVHRQKFINLHEYAKTHPREIKEVNGVRVCCSKEFLIGKGSDGTRVYVGLGNDGVEKAVKRLPRDSCSSLAEQEKKILNQLNTMESKHVINYWFLDEQSDKDYLFLMLDLCEETLENFVGRSSETDLVTCAPDVIEQVLKGLVDLHSDPEPILHRDLKPFNILRNVQNNWLLADFGISRILEAGDRTYESISRGSEYWKAVESCSSEATTNDSKSNNVRYKKESDIQVAGMVAFYIVTKGGHPFGAKPDRLRNLLDGKPVGLDTLKDEATKDLIAWMLKHDPKDRPTAEEALKHPYLQPLKQQFELLCKVGNQQEIKTGDNNSPVVQELNKDLTDWRAVMTTDVLKYLCTDFMNGKPKVFCYKSSWTECLRLIRNVNQHWLDRPRPRPQPEAFYQVEDPQTFFLNLFPSLPVKLHRIIRSRDDLKEYFI